MPGEILQKTTRRHHFEDGYALIIGISHYRNAPRLSETILKDALKLHDILRDPKICGYRDSQVRLLTDDYASAKAIRNELYWLSRHASPNATVFIYFSGHGWKVEEQSQEYYYLLAHDSDPEDLKATAIAGDELTILLNNIQPQRLFFCVDSCYAGGIGEIKGVTPVVKAQALEEHYYEQLAQGTGRAIIASSRSDEPSLAYRSMNNSLFTSYLLEALQGKALYRDDGLIHVLDVFHYISQHIKQYNQHAILKTNRFETNFPIALAPVESPAPTGKVTYQIYSARESQALLLAEKKQLIDIIANLYDFIDGGVRARRLLLTMAGLHQFTTIINLSDPPHLAAQDIIEQLGTKGYLIPERPAYHALGALLSYVLTLPSVGSDHKRFIASLIVHYSLVCDPAYIAEICTQYHISNPPTQLSTSPNQEE
jgi:hypothetical protein